MTAKIISGIEIAKDIREELKVEVEELKLKIIYVTKEKHQQINKCSKLETTLKDLQ